MFEIKNNRGELMFVADQDLYNRIVSDIITLGNYSHTFHIFDGRLSATFKTISSGEQAELANKVKDMENTSEIDLISLSHYLSRINMSEVDIQINGSEDALNKLKMVPAPLMDKILQYYGIFLVLVGRAFERDDIVKNLPAPAVG